MKFFLDCFLQLNSKKKMLFGPPDHYDNFRNILNLLLSLMGHGGAVCGFSTQTVSMEK